MTVLVVDTTTSTTVLVAPTLSTTQLNTIETFQATNIQPTTSTAITATTELPPIIIAGTDNPTAVAQAIATQSTIGVNKVFDSGTTGATVLSTLAVPTYTMPQSTDVVAVIPPIVTPYDVTNGQFVTTPPLDTIVPGQPMVIPVQTAALSDTGVKEIDIQSKSGTTFTAAPSEYFTVEVNKNIPPTAGVPPLASSGVTDKLTLFVDVKYPFEETGVGFNWGNAANFDHPPTLTIQIPKPAAGSGLETDANGCQVSDIFVFDPATNSWTTNTVTVLSTTPSATNLNECDTVVQTQHFSKFAIGGIVPALAVLGLGHEGGGPGGSSLNSAEFSSASGQFGGILATAANGYDVPTNVVQVGDPFQITLDLGAPSALSHVVVYADLNGGIRSYDQSDAYFEWQPNKPLQITDPNGLFSSVDYSIAEKNNAHIVLVFNMTYAKPMLTSDIVVRHTATFSQDNNVVSEDRLPNYLLVNPIPSPEVVPPPAPTYAIPAWVNSDADGGLKDKSVSLNL